MPQRASAAPAPRSEPRWPVALSILAVLALLILLPDRIRLMPPAALYAAGAAVLVPIALAAISPQSATWLRIERGAILAFGAVAAAANLAVLVRLVSGMIRRSQEADALHLLSSSIAIWATNVLMFTLLYWQLDRGGPTRRASDAPGRPDWIFPADQAPPGSVLADWRPQFIDYLFLGFSTATAFSTTDALPLSGRAKLAMMTESTISLVTLAVVAARAINILGS